MMTPEERAELIALRFHYPPRGGLYQEILAALTAAKREGLGEAIKLVQEIGEGMSADADEMVAAILARVAELESER